MPIRLKLRCSIFALRYDCLFYEKRESYRFHTIWRLVALGGLARLVLLADTTGTTTATARGNIAQDAINRLRRVI
jgi:hypothetical protein